MYRYYYQFFSFGQQYNGNKKQRNTMATTRNA